MSPRPPGTLIHNRYRVVREIGSGTFGEVYEVFDQHQNTAAALKLLKETPGAGVWAEAQILTELRSSYILEVWNADIAAGVPFIVTALAQGGSADAHMAPLGVPPVKAIRQIRDAARGAARTHQAHLLHRDIKPGNVFLAQAGAAKLGDFGIAHLMDEQGQAPAHGTLVTIAPEVAANLPCSVASDVYSLGATLYALLAGRYAHQDPDPAVLSAAVQNDPPPPLRDLAPHVSQALAKRVHTAMARDPADRYATAEDFATALGELPAQGRAWSRTDEHEAHARCWRGEGGAKTPVTVCLVEAGARFEVLAAHHPSGRRIAAACCPPAPPSAIIRNLRAAVRHLS